MQINIIWQFATGRKKRHFMLQVTVTKLVSRRWFRNQNFFVESRRKLWLWEVSSGTVLRNHQVGGQSVGGGKWEKEEEEKEKERERERREQKNKEKKRSEGERDAPARGPTVFPPPFRGYLLRNGTFASWVEAKSDVRKFTVVTATGSRWLIVWWTPNRHKKERLDQPAFGPLHTVMISHWDVSRSFCFEACK